MAEKARPGVGLMDRGIAIIIIAAGSFAFFHFYSLPERGALIEIRGTVKDTHIRQSNSGNKNRWLTVEHDGRQLDLCIDDYNALHSIKTGDRIVAKGYDNVLNWCDYQLMAVAYENGETLISYNQFKRDQKNTNRRIQKYLAPGMAGVGLILLALGGWKYTRAKR